MGLLNLFRKKTSEPRPGARQQEQHRLAASLYEITEQILNLDAQIGTIHMVLRRHNTEITECRDLTERHGKALMRLEELVAAPSDQPSGRHSHGSLSPILGTPARTLDIDRFSEQQKRLLGVFFQNKDRHMSCADVAAVLGKAAGTVKNQINQIRHKADLFDCAIGPQSRNFFKLKDDLKVEKLLKTGRPIERPVSTTPPTQADSQAAPDSAKASSSYQKPRTSAGSQAAEGAEYLLSGA
jgi:hypothetical protein